MDTIKTAFVVALLLAVLYGVYVVLNKEQVAPPTEVTDMLKSMDEDEFLGPSIDSGAADGEEFVPLPAPRESEPESPVPEPQDKFGGLPPAGPQYGITNPPRSSPYLRQEDADAASDEPRTDADPDYPDPGADAPDAGVPSDPYAPRDEAPVQDSDNSELDHPDYPGAPESGVEQPRAEYPRNTLPGTGAELGSPDGSTPPQQPGYGQSPQEDPSHEAPTYGSETPADDVTNVLQEAQGKIAEKEYVQALLTLSAAYTHELSDEARHHLEELLDPLAAKVIYSREHLLATPYTARGDETLMQIAADHQVPWQLLQNINGIENPNVLLPGRQLKVLQGPFRAEVDTERGELTLYLQQMYAGRFVISVGNQPRPIPNDYMIISKDDGRPYLAPDGSIIPANDPKNPYGDVFLDLGKDGLGIHGSAATGTAAPGLGCISLSPRDAHDVFGILSLGSQVTIVR